MGTALGKQNYQLLGQGSQVHKYQATQWLPLIILLVEEMIKEGARNS